MRVSEKRGRVCLDDGVDEEGVEQRGVSCRLHVSMTGVSVRTILALETPSVIVSLSIEAKLWNDVGSWLAMRTWFVMENPVMSNDGLRRKKVRPEHGQYGETNDQL